MRFDDVLLERLAWTYLEQGNADDGIRAVLAELSKTHAIVPLEEYAALQEIAKAAVCCRRTIQEVANSGWADSAIVANNDANGRFHRAVYAWMNTTWEGSSNVPHAH